jgi:hypothetical protein
MSCQWCNWNKPNSKLANHFKSKQHLLALEKEKEKLTMQEQYHVTDELDYLESLIKTSPARLVESLDKKLQLMMDFDLGKDRTLNKEEKEQKSTKYKYLIIQLLMQIYKVQHSKKT